MAKHARHHPLFPFFPLPLVPSTSNRSARLIQHGLVLALATWLSAPLGARAQSAEVPAPAPSPPSVPAPSLTELKARAYDAQQAQKAAARAAEEARAAAAAAAAQAAEAERALEAAGAAATTAPPAVPPPPPPSALIPVATAPMPLAQPSATAAAAPKAEDPELAAAREELERATQEAEKAAAAARAATRALQEHMREREERYARRGLFLTAGALYAPELFDSWATIDNSRGAWGGIGYRFVPHFEVEARFDWLGGFDVSGEYPWSPWAGEPIEGEFENWATTLNARLFLLTKSFQPYFGLGLGAIRGTTDLRVVGGEDFLPVHDTELIFRVGGGFDFYVTETLALTVDAAVNVPGGDLSGLNYATLSGGLKLRF